MDNKKYILFVDDEPRIINGLKRMLNHMKKDWDMQFVSSGKEALKLMGETTFDVLVSDMRMPEMNGAELLKQVKQLYPQTICFILSGFSDLKMILKTVGPADQFLNKPCSPETLKTAILKALNAQNIIENEQIRSMISKNDSLPSMPTIYAKLSNMISQPYDYSYDEISTVINQDIAMTAKFLKVVNSAFFGIKNPVKSIRQAIAYLGIETIKSLVLTNNIFIELPENIITEFNLQELYTHSTNVGLIADKIQKTYKKKTFEDGNQPSEEAFIAGMLHDVGKLILIKNSPEKYKIIQKNYENSKKELFIIEKQKLTTSHTELGGYLMTIWGLQKNIVDSLIYHHNPLEANINTPNILTAVHVANALVHANDPNDNKSKINMKYIKSIQLEKLVPQWITIAETHLNQKIDLK